MSDVVDFPNGWVISALGEVCKLRNGYAFKSDLYTKIGVPVIRISDIGDGKVNTTSCVRVEIKDTYLDYKVGKGDILVAMSGATTGKFGIYKSDELAFQNQRVGRFEVLSKDILDNDYLLYLLFRLKQRILDDAYGGAQPNISSGKIEEMEIPLPPLAEQQRIVAKIEELFSELDKGIETLKTAQQQLKVYRQAVLKYAFEGKLTNPDVKEGELPEGWKMTTLNEVTSKITDGEHFRPKTTTSGIPFLSAKDVRDNGVSFDNPLFIDKETAAKALQRCCPTTGDILIVSRGATVGRMCLVNTDQTFCLLGSVILLKVDKSIFNKYLLFLLKSASINQKIISVSGATAQQAIYLRDIKGIEILLPPMDEQVKIVDEIESRLSVCDKIEQSIEQGLQQAEALRQSILKKAFEGKLVPQDPNDEPASVLLDRIKTERAAAQPEKKNRTKKVKA